MTPKEVFNNYINDVCSTCTNKCNEHSKGITLIKDKVAAKCIDYEKRES